MILQAPGTGPARSAPTIWPASKTKIRSACSAVESRWAIVITVRPAERRLRASVALRSVADSKDEPILIPEKSNSVRIMRAGQVEIVKVQ